MRVVLPGASNLALALPRVVSAAREAPDARCEFLVATGFGRSYGQGSRFFWKKFSGILSSGIWSALELASPLPTVAVLTDVGNDLVYEAPVECIVHWVATALDRLAQHRARVVLNNLPIESLPTAGTLRYSAQRALLFRQCRLRRSELLVPAEALRGAFADLAAMRKIPAFSAKSGRYGLDPIHPRSWYAGAARQHLLSEVAPAARPIAWTRPPRVDARLIGRAQARCGAGSAPRDAAKYDRVRLSDCSTIALF